MQRLFFYGRNLKWRGREVYPDEQSDIGKPQLSHQLKSFCYAEAFLFPYRRFPDNQFSRHHKSLKTNRVVFIFDLPNQ